MLITPSVVFAEHDTATVQDTSPESVSPPASEKASDNQKDSGWDKLPSGYRIGAGTPGSTISDKDGNTIGYIDNDNNPVMGKLTDKDNNGFADQLERFTVSGPDKDGKITEYGKYNNGVFILNKDRIKQLLKEDKIKNSSIREYKIKSETGSIKISEMGYYVISGHNQNDVETQKIINKLLNIKPKDQKLEKDSAKLDKSDSKKMNKLSDDDEKKAMSKKWVK